MLFDLGRDVRYAFRVLWRSPGLAAAIVLILAIGIGANTVVFSAVDAVLLRDAPVADPDRVVDVYTSSGNNPYGSSSYPDYFDLRNSGAFGSLAAYALISVSLDEQGETQALPGALVSGNYFDVLGIAMPFGRGFAPEEDEIGAPAHVAVISHALWERTFGADRTLVGRTIRLNSRPYTLIGVAPRGFSGALLGVATDVWVPAALQPELDPVSAALQRSRGHAGKFDLRGSRGLNMVARLRPGTSSVESASRAEVVSSRLQAEYPQTNRNRWFTVAPLNEGRGLRVSTRSTLQQVSAAAAIVLFVACINVAGLLVARAVSRETEVAVRIAVGASHARLVRQWLAESLVLAMCGSIGALLVARLLMPLLHTFVVPEAVDLSLNMRILAFTLVVGIGTGVLFGLAPVFRTPRRNATAALRAEGGAIASGARASRMRNAFVVLQIALSLVVLVGAALFLRTLWNAYAVDPGFEVDDTLVATVNLQPRGYSPEAGLAAYKQILSAVNGIPGVIAAGAARMTVLSGGARSTAVSIDRRPIEKDDSNALGVRANVVSHRYFEAMNIPIVSGRPFALSDDSGTPRVAIVNQSLAARLWPTADAIGQILRDEDNRLQVVVGVVPDTVYTSVLERDTRPTFYLLLAQNYESAIALHVRSAGDPMALVPSIREAVRRVDSQIALERAQRLREVLDRSLSRERMLATLVGLFGAMTLLLTVFGLYGVMAYLAAQRTREIGIRLAIGAQPASIRRLLMGHGLRLLAIGSALGLAAALVCARFIETHLFGVKAADPLTFAAVTVVLGLTCLAACAIPAVRAMRLDPIAALRP